MTKHIHLLIIMILVHLEYERNDTYSQVPIFGLWIYSILLHNKVKHPGRAGDVIFLSDIFYMILVDFAEELSSTHL
jgi:hypothetical protein